MEFGVLSTLSAETNQFEPLERYRVGIAQLCNWNMDILTPEVAEKVRRDMKSSRVRIAAFWAGYRHPCKWNPYDGPYTCGLVPPEYRADRLADLKKGADFATMIGAPAIVTHCGFIPEFPRSPLYLETLKAIEEIAVYCHERGLGFWFESGQETPVTLLRTIEDLQLPNLGINLDTANLILYGTGNPVDALDVFGKYVRNLHIKDGFCPVDSRHNGKHAPVGMGAVDFRAILRKLKKLDFHGELIVEREIKGEQQARDIMAALEYLDAILTELENENTESR